MVNQLSPDLVIEPANGKTILLDAFPFEQIEGLPGVKGIVKIAEEDALFRYGDRQHVGVLKGVSEGFEQLTAMDSIITQGVMLLKYKNQEFAMLGAGVAWYLDINARNPAALCRCWCPHAETLR